MSGKKSTRLTPSVVKLRGAAMARRLMTWALVVIVLLAAVPVLTVLTALVLDLTLGCNLGESNKHPCVFLGFDFGGLLSDTGFFGIRISLVTVPLAGMLLAVWLLVLIVLLLLRRRRGAAPL
jgi:hypothetical protein